VAKVDYQELVHRLDKALHDGLPEKSAWGTRELRTLIADLRIECAVAEAPTDRIFRLFGDELADALFGRTTADVQPTRGGSGDETDRASDRDGSLAEVPRHREAEASEGRDAWLQQRRDPRPLTTTT
jgi:hypothetical protein